VKGGHKTWISYSLTLIFSLLHYLGGFEVDLDLDPNGGERKLDLRVLTYFHMALFIFLLCVCKVVTIIMDREESMYKIPRVSNDLAFLGHVRKFVAAVKKHMCIWIESASFVRAIAARTTFSRKITWCSLT